MEIIEAYAQQYTNPIIVLKYVYFHQHIIRFDGCTTQTSPGTEINQEVADQVILFTGILQSN